MSSTLLVKCPTCKKDATFDSSNPYRPFCSERCKIGDLAKWATEQYTIPVSGSEKSERLPDEFEEENMADGDLNPPKA